MATKITIGAYSAYAIAVKYGYTGTEEEWINSVETARKVAESARKVAESAAEHADNCMRSADNTLTVIRNLQADWLLSAYPVGSLYLSTDPTSPAELFGGTWEQIAQDRALMGASSSHAAGTTAEAGLPNVSGEALFGSNASLVRDTSVLSGCFTTGSTGIGGVLTFFATSESKVGRPLAFNASRSSNIYGASTTVQPPAYYVNVWQRVK